jgi:hypothetical protein
LDDDPAVVFGLLAEEGRLLPGGLRVLDGILVAALPGLAVALDFGSRAAPIDAARPEGGRSDRRIGSGDPWMTTGVDRRGPRSKI